MRQKERYVKYELFWLLVLNQSPDLATRPVVRATVAATQPCETGLFLRCGTVTQWRMSSWARWCCPARWRTPQAHRSFSWGKGGETPTRCPETSAWGSSRQRSSLSYDLQITWVWSVFLWQMLITDIFVRRLIFDRLNVNSCYFYNPDDLNDMYSF